MRYSLRVAFRALTCKYLFRTLNSLISSNGYLVISWIVIIIIYREKNPTLLNKKVFLCGFHGSTINIYHFSAPQYRMEMLLSSLMLFRYQLSFLIIIKTGHLSFCYDLVITELHFNHNDSQLSGVQTFIWHSWLFMITNLHTDWP